MWYRFCAGALIACGIERVIFASKTDDIKLSTIAFALACINFFLAINLLKDSD